MLPIETVYELLNIHGGFIIFNIPAKLFRTYNL